MKQKGYDITRVNIFTEADNSSIKKRYKEYPYAFDDLISNTKVTTKTEWTR